jgi:hypothetical protein
MRALCVTLIFLAVLLFSPSKATGWIYWLVRGLALLWAIWLQRRLLEAKP